MGIANKYNKGNGFNFRVPDSFGYVTLEDMYKYGGEGVVYPVNAIYINKKSQYGDAPVIATDSCLVNIPSHLLDTVTEMLKDEEVFTAVNNGELGFSIYPYSTDKRKGTFYSIKWVDIEKE